LFIYLFIIYLFINSNGVIILYKPNKLFLYFWIHMYARLKWLPINHLSLCSIYEVPMTLLRSLLQF